MKRDKSRGEKKTYDGQTMVAEEKWRFMLLSSQRAKLKSAITVAIRSATAMAMALHEGRSFRGEKRNRGARGKRVEKEEMATAEESPLIWDEKIEGWRSLRINLKSLKTYEKIQRESSRW